MDQQGMPGPMTQASRLKKVSGLVQHLIRAALVKIVELAGIKILNLLYTANINMTHVFKHPKFYRIPRDKSDQAISKRTCDGESERASDPGHKPQAASSKLQAASDKQQYRKHKHQASSHKQQAT
mgnify:CR=1 FL=1